MIPSITSLKSVAIIWSKILQIWGIGVPVFANPEFICPSLHGSFTRGRRGGVVVRALASHQCGLVRFLHPASYVG